MCDQRGLALTGTVETAGEEVALHILFLSFSLSTTYVIFLFFLSGLLCTRTKKAVRTGPLLYVVAGPKDPAQPPSAPLFMTAPFFVLRALFLHILLPIPWEDDHL